MGLLDFQFRFSSMRKAQTEDQVYVYVCMPSQAITRDNASLSELNYLEQTSVKFDSQ